MPRHPLLPILTVGALLAGAALLLSRPRKALAPVADVPVAYTVDVGPEAGGVLNLPPPPKPFKGQLTQCRPRVHTRINGGCWRKLAERPPCEEAYLWEASCYLPVMSAERPATSIHP